MSPKPSAIKAEETTLSLVLGSGGARGLAHIGVIRELEKAGFRIASISGCSIGAMVGGVYAAGKLDEFEDWVCAIRKVDIVKLLDIAWEKNGLMKGDRIMDTLTELVGDQQIEDLAIPFTAVASDLSRQKEVWLRKGSLFDAIRASISLPLLLTPVAYKDSLLIDGGVLNPVPIAPTLNDRTDFTLAVNLGGRLKEPSRSARAAVTDSEAGKSDERSLLHRKLVQFIGELGSSMSESDTSWGMYDIGNQAFDVMQSAIARHQLAVHPPDYVIEVPRNACGLFEVDRAREMISIGRNKTAALLAELSL
ncbi:MAG: patatin-like phospholipase family protein [Pseudomonadota bacterium]